MHPANSPSTLRSVLRGDVICSASSELDSAEQITHIEEQVTRLGATFVDALGENVTHLVCDRAGGPVHRAACAQNSCTPPSQRVIVVLPSYLEACIRAALRVHIQSHLLPPLAGLELCCSGIPIEEKAHIEKLAQDLGAHYSKALGASCTHLICTTPSGRKYDYAKNNRFIYIVRPRWILECSNLNTLVEETPFSLSTGRHRSSAPDDDENGSRAPTSVVNPSLTDSGSRAPASRGVSSPTIAPEVVGIAASSSAVTIKPSLDALRVYLTESSLRDSDKHGPLRTKALRLLARAAATLISDPRLGANYVVVLRIPVLGSSVSSIRTASESGVPIVSLRWLEDCVTQNTILDSSKYLVRDWEREGASATTGARLSRDSLPSQSASQLAIALPSSVFTGCRVSLGALWLRDEEACTFVERQLIAGRAKVLQHDSSGVVTTGVATHIVCACDMQSRERSLLMTAKRANAHVVAVTAFWVDSCTATGSLLPVGSCALFAPLEHSMPLRGMQEQRVSITLSGFQRRGETEWNSRREVLSRLADLLGARYSEKLRRRGTTHVVADVRAGLSDKIKRAREWGIHIVSYEWLLTCAKSGNVVAPEAFAVNMNTLSRNDEAQKSSGVSIRRPPVRPPVSQAPQKVDKKEAPPDIEAISLFKRLKAGLDERAIDELEDGIAVSNGDGDDEHYRGRRSRSNSRDAIAPEKEWSMDASQSQVIVHRDLTPPPTPKSKGRSMLTRASKRARLSD